MFTKKSTQKPPDHTSNVQEIERLRTALEHSIAALAVVDEHGTITFVNTYFAHLHEYTPQQLLNIDIRSLQDPEFASNKFGRILMRAQSQRSVTDEFRHITASRRAITLYTRVTYTHAASGSQFVLSAQDITEQKAREEKLQEKANELERTKLAMLNVLEDIESERNKLNTQVLETKKFEMAVTSSTDGIVITNPNNEIIYVNDAWSSLNGYTPQEAVGKKPTILQSGKTKPETYEKMWNALKAGKSFITEDVINKRKDGSEYDAQLSIFPIIENSKVIFYVAIQQDISKRKEVDRAKTEFVSLASHQLRTPLSSINWYAEMLLAGDAGSLNEEQKSYVSEIYSGNKRMVDLVNALLNVSRIELGTFMVEPEQTDIVALVQDVIKELEPKIFERKLDVKESYDPTIQPIMADKKLFRIVVQNLVSNAIKYTPISGSVTITLKLARPEKLDPLAHKQVLKLIVVDTGLGIPHNQQDKIFTKLFRADNVRKTDTEGNGLGLYIVRSIVEQSEGKIWFTTQENKGTTFTIELPLAGMQQKKGTKSLADNSE